LDIRLRLDLGAKRHMEDESPLISAFQRGDNRSILCFDPISTALGRYLP
jgi:hypothetical protein